VAAQLSWNPGHFAEAIIREVLSLPFFNGLQNDIRDEFGLVAIYTIGGRPAAGWIPHLLFLPNFVAVMNE
jgi:hypothetical protein